MQLLKKLGAKQILGNVKKVVTENCKNDGDIYKAYSIYGIASGTKTGTSQFGDWMAYTGSFEAVNYITGESIKSIQAFIPEPLNSIIKEGLLKHETVQFAFTVSVKRRDDTKEGYEYLVEPHTNVTSTDELSQLRALLPDLTEKTVPKKSTKKIA